MVYCPSYLWCRSSALEPAGSCPHFNAPAALQPRTIVWLCRGGRGGRYGDRERGSGFMPESGERPEIYACNLKCSCYPFLRNRFGRN